MAETGSNVTRAVRFASLTTLSLAAVVAQNLTTWDGVYSHDQAQRGAELYQKQCASCHKASLNGSAVNPPLAGDEFRANWTGQPLGSLFDKIQTSMPADHPGTLQREETAAITAYMLSKNGFPEGKSELSTDAERLKQIRFEAKRP